MKTKASPLSLGHRAPGPQAALSVCLSGGCRLPGEGRHPGFLCLSSLREESAAPRVQGPWLRIPFGAGVPFPALVYCLSEKRRHLNSGGWVCAVASLVSGDHGVLRPSASERHPVGPRNDADTTEGCHGRHS